MTHAENKLNWCLKKVEKEGKEHRGLKIINPDMEKANKHIEKAMHNLGAVQYLMRGGYVDWAVNAGFYTMYHCLLAVLAKNGYESRNQECTFAAMRVLIDEKKSDISIEQLNKIATFDEEATKEEIIKLREEFQYGTGTIIDTEIIKRLINEAKEFIELARLDLRKQL